MTLRNKAVSGVKWTGFSTGVVTCLQFTTLAVLARLLEPSDFGLMGMLTVITGFVQIFADMGISSALISKQNITRDLFSSLYWLNVLTGIIFFLVVIVLAPLITSFFHEPRLKDLVYLAALSFIVSPFGYQFQVLMQKDLSFDLLAKIEIASSLSNSIVAVIMAVGGLGVFSLIWGQLAGLVVRVFFSVMWGWKEWKPRLYFSSHGLRDYLNFGLYQMGERCINFFNSNLDYLFIGSLLGAKQLGYYTLAYNLMTKPVYLINPIMTKVAFPVFSRIQNDAVKLKEGYHTMLRIISTINFPLLISLAAISPIAVPFIFGVQWLPSILLIQILLGVGIARSIMNPTGALLLSKGRADWGFLWNLSNMVVQIPVLYMGVKIGGMVGVAAAFSLIMLIFTVFSYWTMIRRLIMSSVKEYTGTMSPYLCMSLVSGLVIYLIGRYMVNYPLAIVFSTQLIAGMAAYFILFVLFQKKYLIEIKNIVVSQG